MKLTDALPSLVQGVSEQRPEERRAGQLGEAVNTIPDPVNGLARRHGSAWVAELNLAASTNFAQAQSDAKGFRSLDYTHDGVEYTLLTRRRAKTVGSPLPLAVIFNRTTSAFLPVSVVVDGATQALDLGGLSAAAVVGRYVLMAGNSTTVTGTTVDLLNSATNRPKSVVWVRGGAYSRTFRVTATKSDNSVVTFQYTTPQSSYPATLDISGVPVYAADPAGGTSTDTEAAYIKAAGEFGEFTLGWASWTPSALTAKNGASAMTNVHPANPTTTSEFSWAPGAATIKFAPALINSTQITVTYTHVKTVSNPNYARTVNELTAAYNSAVTQWIGTSAAAVAPSAIAEQLRLAAVAAGLTTATRVDSTVTFDNVIEVVAQDGGDGSLIRGVDNEVSGADQVSTVHWAGKVVKVQAQPGADAYYLKAVPKKPGAAGWQEVTWVEGAGVEHTLSGGLFYGTVHAGVFYIASSAAALATVVPGTHPAFNVSTVGDLDSVPMPFFAGRRISYLGVFQDRLLVGAGAVLHMSETGNYLNFFRSTLLTSVASDAFQLISRGSEDDELRHDVTYDRDLVIFGRERQYVLSGRVPLTPTNANMPVMSKHSGAGDTAPIAVGGLIFYAKLGNVASSVHQIQPGNVAESPESYLASSQLDRYLSGEGLEMVSVSKPTALFLRTSANPNNLFVFNYLDLQDGRRQDAWHRWQFNAELGDIIGMAPQRDNLLVFTVRQAFGRIWVVVDRCSMLSELSSTPYLDSWRPWSTVVSGLGSLRPNSGENFVAAYNSASQYRFFGDGLPSVDAVIAEFGVTGLVVGARQDSYFTLTNPFPRNGNGKALLTGSLTITRYTVNYSSSSGLLGKVTSESGDSVTRQNARYMGSPLNVIGDVIVADGTASVPVGREVKNCEVTIQALDWWPLTVTSIGWTGQLFQRARSM